MSSEEKDVRVAFEEDRLGTHREENAVPPEPAISDANSKRKPKIKQAEHDMPMGHPDKKILSDFGVKNFPNEPQTKQAEHAFVEEQKLTNQFTEGCRIDLLLDQKSQLEEMVSRPATSPSAECWSKINKSPFKIQLEVPDVTLVNGSFDMNAQNKLEEPAIDDEQHLTDQSSKEYQIQKISESEEIGSHPVPSLLAKSLSMSPVTNQKEVRDGSNNDLVLLQFPVLQPVADNCIQNDQPHINCQKLPSATAPSLVQHEISQLNGASDREPRMEQPEPVLNNEQTLTAHSVHGYQINDSLGVEMSQPESSLVASPGAQVESEPDESPDLDLNEVPGGSKKKLNSPQLPNHQPVATFYKRHIQLQNSRRELPSVTAPSLVHRNVTGGKLNDPRLGSLFPVTALNFPDREFPAASEAKYHPKPNPSNPRLPLLQQTSVTGSAFEKPPGRSASMDTRNAYEFPTASRASSVATGVHAFADRMLHSANGSNNNDSIYPSTGHKRSRGGKHIMADGAPSNGVPKVKGAEQDNLRHPAPRPFSWSTQGRLSFTSPNQNSSNAPPPKHGGNPAPSNVSTRARRVSASASNSLYSPYYEQLGLPVDPMLRAFLEYNRRNAQGNVGGGSNPGTE